MKCVDCGAENSDDGLFCKSCGRHLPKAVKQEVVDFERLLSDGYDSLHAGKIGEARLAAESILRCDPTNASALALRAMVHERAGEIEAAIDTYEQIVSQNPGSSHDRHKLLELKAKLYHRQPPRPASTWLNTPLITATLTAAIVLVAVLSFTIWVMRNQNVDAAEEGGTQVAGLPQGGPAAYPQNSGAWQQPAQGNQQPQQQPNNTAGTPSRSTGAYDPNLPTGALIPPVQPVEQPGPVYPGATYSNNDSSGANSVVMDDTPGSTTQDKPSGPEEIIEISVNNSGAGSNHSAGPALDQQALSYLKVARSQQQQGSYREAIQSYQRALPGLRYPGATHQQIALCYYRLGDKTNAADSYRKAITAYERQLQDRVEVEGARSGIESCRSGLRLLGG